MASEKLRNIRNYLIRNARCLDIARWNYHFEDGSDEDVLKALVAYQNPDGGFSNGLKPGLKNLISNSLDTLFAVQVLREIDYPEIGTNFRNKIIRYLERTFNTEELNWKVDIIANNKYLHSTWFTLEEDCKLGDYSPNIEFTGFLLRFCDESSDNYEYYKKSLDKILKYIDDNKYELPIYEISSLVHMYRDLKSCGKENMLPKDFESKLKEKIDDTIDKDSSKYHHDRSFIPPSLFIEGKDDFLYPGNEKICSYFAKYIEDSVNPIGFWSVKKSSDKMFIPRDVLKIARGILTVDNMLFIERIVK
ncbi:MAG: hypothetical protein Q4P34_01840 [Tissierellia bacterium]|nr:hypothetical protein [Tissierellia bacterium]